MPVGFQRDRYGIRAYIKVGGIQRTKRFPPDTPAKIIQTWRDEVRVALRLARPARPRGTLNADIERYLTLESVKQLASFGSRRSELTAWSELYGTWNRSAIKRLQILEARDRWLAEGYAPKTVNNRVETLRLMYQELDGPKVPTPCDDIRKLKVPDADPQFVPVSTIRRVARNLARYPIDQARFLVLTSTGQRPAQLKRTQPGDVDLRRKVWWVKPAKGGKAIPVFLNDDMMAAWRQLLAVTPLQRDDGAAIESPFMFDTSLYDKRLYKAGWPITVRPYNAKHTVGLALAEAGAEWEDIRDFFGHRDSKTTKIYTGLVASRLKDASRRLEDRRLGWAEMLKTKKRA